MFECDIVYSRSVAVLCKLYKLRRNPTHPLYGAYLYRMCQFGLRKLLWSHIDILLRIFAGEPRSTAGLFLTDTFTEPKSIRLCGTILPTLDSMVWDWLVSKAVPMFLLALAVCFLFDCYCFHFIFFLSIGWHYGAAIFGLIGC